VRRSRRAIGIRVAIGAQRADVLRFVLGRTALLIGIGGVLGLSLALAVARLMASVLYGTSPDDPTAIGAAIAALLAAAAAASVGPTWRAASIDPVEVLRDN